MKDMIKKKDLERVMRKYGWVGGDEAFKENSVGRVN